MGEGRVIKRGKEGRRKNDENNPLMLRSKSLGENLEKRGRGKGGREGGVDSSSYFRRGRREEKKEEGRRGIFHFIAT